MADKLIRDVDNDVWNQFAGLAKAVHMPLGKFLTLILKEHLEKKGVEVPGRNLVDVAVSIKEQQEITLLSKMLARRIVNNTFEDFRHLKTKVEKNQVSVYLNDEWERMDDFDLNMLFDRLDNTQKKIVLNLLLQEMTEAFGFIGKDSLQQISEK